MKIKSEIFLNLNNNIDYNLLETFINEVDYPITYGGNIDNIQIICKTINSQISPIIGLII